MYNTENLLSEPYLRFFCSFRRILISCPGRISSRFLRAPILLRSFMRFKSCNLLNRPEGSRTPIVQFILTIHLIVLLQYRSLVIFRPDTLAGILLKSSDPGENKERVPMRKATIRRKSCSYSCRFCDNMYRACHGAIIPGTGDRDA